MTHFLLTDCDQQRHLHYSTRGLVVAEIPFCRLCQSIFNRPSFVLFPVYVCMNLPSVFWRCWMGDRKGIRPVKTERWGAGVVICPERGAGLHMAHLMPLPLTVSCFSKSQIGLPFWYRFTRVVPDKGPLNGCRVCMYECMNCVCVSLIQPQLAAKGQ